MEPRLASILSNYQGKREEVIPLLQAVQNEYSFLPEEAMVEIANFTHVPDSQIYAVATFYAQFRFKPRGENHVMVCRGTACHVSGAARVLEDVEESLGIMEGETTEDLEYSLETVACIGACSLAPCVMINKKVEARMDKKKVQALFGKGE